MHDAQASYQWEGIIFSWFFLCLRRYFIWCPPLGAQLPASALRPWAGQLRRPRPRLHGLLRRRHAEGELRRDTPQLLSEGGSPLFGGES